MTETTWDEVLAMEGLAGRELEYKRGRDTFRGKIGRTELIGGIVLFHFEWLNKLSRQGVWFTTENHPLGVQREFVRPLWNEDGDVEFRLLTQESACIYRVRPGLASALS